MWNWEKWSRVICCSAGLTWSATAGAQSLPSPAAPAANAPKATPTSAAAVPQGVISAEHVFGQPPAKPIQQTMHECPICGNPACPNACQPECEDEGYHCCLFNPDAEAFDLSDSFWNATGYESSLNVGGWLQGGYTNKSDGVFNTHPDHFDAQQVYLYAEKVADGSEGLDFGFRVDALYGTDAQNTQSFGNHFGRYDFSAAFQNSPYGWALPQAFVEASYQDWNVKVGHFYTLLGYQVVPATGNFFYSIPFTFNFSEAFTHTGALATYKGIENVTIYGGWTLGWDTGFDQLNGGNSFLGGISFPLFEDCTLTYIATAGNLGWIGKGYTHSVVADYLINDDWEYVFQSDLVSVDSPGGGHYDTVGVNQYLYYAITDGIKAGGRFEWWKQDGTSFYEATLGVNFIPLPNVRIRPEARYQWSPAGDNAGNNTFGIPLDETILGVDVIVTF